MLYIHIPFCKSRCIYCNFFSTTLLARRKDYVDVLIQQIPDKTYSTIYIGGGTPSMLGHADLQNLLTECSKHIAADGEFTVECNPDDITDTLADLLSRCGVNRVSLGIQTFSNERLRLINRRHSAEKAREAVSILRARNINNVSIDLMFGFPSETISDWTYDISEAIKLIPKHISAYCLSIEEDTALDRMLQTGKLPPLPSETELEDMYYTLCTMLRDAGYEHYEISNFAQPDYHSRHNSGYWQDKSYDAIGAGAHGYSKEQRRRYWNICDVEKYIAKARAGESVVEDSEDIDDITHYNDLITTALRTSRGLSLSYIQDHCPAPLYEYFVRTATRLKAQQLVQTIEDGNEKRVRLSPTKLFVSDDILSEFVYVENH